MKSSVCSTSPFLPNIYLLFSYRFLVQLGLACTFIQVSCQSAQVDLQTYEGPQLIFGSGGGFTGASTAYALIENGQLYAINILAEDTIPLVRIKKKKAKRLFQQYEKLALQQMDFDHPGNLYYFIEQKAGEQKNRITWGDTQHNPPDSVIDFYQKLREAVPVSKP